MADAPASPKGQNSLLLAEIVRRQENNMTKKTAHSRYRSLSDNTDLCVIVSRYDCQIVQKKATRGNKRLASYLFVPVCYLLSKFISAPTAAQWPRACRRYQKEHQMMDTVEISCLSTTFRTVTTLMGKSFTPINVVRAMACQNPSRIQGTLFFLSLSIERVSHLLRTRREDRTRLGAHICLILGSYVYFMWVDHKREDHDAQAH
eukprot:scaffold148520_cov48-Prasinocladus_malaysianus.AAC.1